MDIIKSIEHEQLKKKTPVINIGDTVRVHVRVKEGSKERIQAFEGIVIKRQGTGARETFTVRRISYGVGVEKTFLIHSPKVEKVEIKRSGSVRRAKLYYLRDRVGKSAKTKENIGGKIGVLEEGEDFDEVPGEPAEVVEEVAVETPVEEVTEEVKAEAPKAEEKKEEAKKEDSTEALEEKPEQAQETVMDTVKEEEVEVVSEKTPVKEDKPEEQKAEVPEAVETENKPEEKKNEEVKDTDKKD